MPEKIIAESKIRHLELDPPLKIATGTPIHSALLEMRKQKQSMALVCRGDDCIGIFTERDFLNKILGLNVNHSTAVDEFMSGNPKTLTPDDTVGKAIVLMHENGFRNIPLVDDKNGKCAGVLRIKNIIDFLAEIYPEEVLNVAPRPERFTAPDGA
jgi:CBS domain-containing protein